jgi:hypothetical protein
MLVGTTLFIACIFAVACGLLCGLSVLAAHSQPKRGRRASARNWPVAIRLRADRYQPKRRCQLGS